MGKPRDGGASATWEREILITFCDLCVKEVELGNRPSTFFNKEGWQNVLKNFNQITSRSYNKLQLKNKWDQLKKDWKLWKELKRGSTGLGWDSKKKTIDASEEWWKEKLQVVPNAKKFRYAGIDPELEEKLNVMFGGVVATGEHSWAPTQEVHQMPEVQESSPHTEDSNDLRTECDYSERLEGESSRSKRQATAVSRTVKKKKGGAAFLRKAVCDFNMCFTFVLAGWEGSAHDSRIFRVATRYPQYNFPAPPPGKYYLVDAGYPLERGYLKPFPDTKYHIPDFERSAHVTRGRKEMFNKRHSSLRGVIERTFGVWKKKWVILRDMTAYPFKKQVKIVVATMALHNYIRRHPSRRDVDFDVLDQDLSYVPPEAYEVRIGQTFQETIQDVVPSEIQDGDGANEMRMLREQITAALVNE